MLDDLLLSTLDGVVRRSEELATLLSDPSIISKRNEFQQLSKESADMAEVVERFREYREILKQLEDNRELAKDPEMRALVEETNVDLERRLPVLEERIKILLLPRDPNDSKNILLEIRSGTGGEEAALFAADLFRMYCRYAETQGWKVEILSTSEAAAGGLKEVIALVTGKDVYGQMRFEGGVHRVQRVPATEAQGRIHTSTATVAVLPEAEEVDVQVDEKDLEISIAASGGPGGQGVNTTNSAVQILHKPSGIIVKCQDERSQLKNTAKALKVLRARLLDIEREKAEAAEASARRSMVSTGERSQKIRTYNYPQNRVSDHRIKLTINKLDRIIEGDLRELITALRTHRQAELLHEAGMGKAPSMTQGDGADE